MVKLTEVQGLGKETDSQLRAEVRKPGCQVLHTVRKAWKAIFKGYKVSGSRIEKLLGAGSRVPTIVSKPCRCPAMTLTVRLPKNTFMNSLPGLNIYALLTVDLLHEVELGVWKALFTHIVRILSIHPGAVDELDRRYALPHLALTSIDTCVFKIPPGCSIWEGHHPPVCKQCISDEEACST